MRVAKRLMIGCVLVTGLYGLAGGVRAQSTPAEGTAMIGGRVTVDGKPARGVAVVLAPHVLDPEKAMARTLESTPTVKVTTDADGRYKFTGLAAGRYDISVFAPAMVAGGSKADDGVTVGDQESIEGIDFSLAAGGVITGTITGGDGRPVIGEAVSVSLVLEQGDDSKSARVTETFATDDRGVYRIYGLPAGRYNISVGSSGIGMESLFGGRHKIQTTYYPGVTSKTKAGVAEVTAGGETTGIDIKIGQPSKTYMATGRVVDDSGKPIANVPIFYGALMADQKSFAPSGFDAHSNSKGEFKIEGLSTGHYGVQASFMFNSESELYSDSVYFEVKYEDVVGLEVKVHRGSSVSGVVVVQGSDDPALAAKLSQLELWGVVRAQEGGGPNLARSKVGSDGSFRLQGLQPGTLHISLNNFVANSGFTMLRIEQNGAEQKGGIKVGAGEQIAGVRIVLAVANCTLQGEVRVEGGKLPQGAGLEVTLRRAVRSESEVSDFFLDTAGGSRVAGVDASGRFRIEGLAPGDYEVTVRVSTAGTDNGSPAAHEARQTVTVTSGVEAQVSLTLDLSSRSKNK